MFSTADSDCSKKKKKMKNEVRKILSYMNMFDFHSMCTVIVRKLLNREKHAWSEAKNNPEEGGNKHRNHTQEQTFAFVVREFS